MKPRYWLMLLAVASIQAAHAADAGNVSPFDANPSCMETTTDSSTGNCVLQTEGSPRHKYPPPGPTGAARNLGGTAGASGTTGMAPSGSGSVGTAPSVGSSGRGK